MHPPIPNEINKILNLSPELWADFEAKLKPLSVNKGEYFLQEGDLCNQVALLSKGAFYSYYRKDGDMVIEDFCLEGCFLADYPPLIGV